MTQTQVAAVVAEAMIRCPKLCGTHTTVTQAHAYALIDSHVYGSALQEAALPFQGPDHDGDVVESIVKRMTEGEYPHLVHMATSYYLQPGYDFGDEFGFGLDLILDGIERMLARG